MKEGRLQYTRQTLCQLYIQRRKLYPYPRRVPRKNRAGIADQISEQDDLEKYDKNLLKEYVTKWAQVWMRVDVCG